MPANVEWLLGLDFGKHHDSTVLSAIRQEVKPLPRKAVPGTPEHDEEPRKLRTHFSLEWMWRPQLGTRYGEIVDTTERVCSNVQFADNYLLLPDATSIGEPIVEMLQSRNLAMVPVATTSGLEPSNMTHRFGYNVPKKDLVDALVVVFQQGLFDYLPNLGYHDRESGRFVDCSKVFAEELDKFVIKKTPTGRPKYVCSNVQFADNYLLLPDATSIGEPIVEMLQSRNLAMVPVATTSGLEPSNMTHRFGYNVPKKDLVDALVVVFQQGLFDYLPNLGYHDRESGRFVDCSKVFAEELDKFVIKKTPTGRPKYEAEDPDKDHDDTIMSCAIPVWYALRGESYERQLERGATRSRRGGQQDEGGWDPLEDWRR